MVRTFVLAFVLGITATVATAQQGFLRSLGSIDDGQGWDAVGRLEIAGTAFCTGALIGPDLVLTAAHCLYDPETGASVPMQDIQFLAGWRNGRAAAYRRVSRATTHPDYVFRSKADTNRVRNDIALLQLQHPINNGQIVPFGTDRSPMAGDRVGVVSYAHNRAEAPALQEMCEVIAPQDGVLILSCEVDFGASGSPVFSFGSGPPRIVSVVSAKAEAMGQPVSLGTMLDGPLERTLEALSSATNLQGGSEGFQSLISSQDRSKSSAKFVRP